MTNFFDFNDADKQRSFDIIPDNTVVTVQLTIHRGGAGDDGWLTRAKDGASEHVHCEFTVVDGDFAKRKIFANFTIRGTTSGHAESGRINRDMFRAILESAHGIHPDDKSEAAEAARRARGWADLDQLRFVVCTGVRPPHNGYAAQNTIKEIITPDRQAWTKPEQIDRASLSKPATGIAAPAQQPTPQPSTPPAGAITRPEWALPEKKES